MDEYIDPWENRVTLLELLSAGPKSEHKRQSIGTLATAIQKHGIYGRDDFGRVQGPEDSDIKHGALELLRTLNLAFREVEFHQDQGLEILGIEAAYYDYDSPLQFYWWLNDSLPDFDAIAAGQEVVADNVDRFKPVQGIILAELMKHAGIDPAKHRAGTTLAAWVANKYEDIDQDKITRTCQNLVKHAKRAVE